MRVRLLQPVTATAPELQLRTGKATQARSGQHCARFLPLESQAAKSIGALLGVESLLFTRSISAPRLQQSAPDWSVR
jgi:hypothetical protein